MLVLTRSVRKCKPGSMSIVNVPLLVVTVNGMTQLLPVQKRTMLINILVHAPIRLRQTLRFLFVALNFLALMFPSLLPRLLFILLLSVNLNPMLIWVVKLLLPLSVLLVYVSEV
ncbi:MAG: hypothetical protein [Microviridae sp.]|nr:MAG: hypothetical protein [Microviridae sp.]